MVSSFARNGSCVGRGVLPAGCSTSSLTRGMAALTAYRVGDLEPLLTCVAAATRRDVGQGRWRMEELSVTVDRWRSQLRVRSGSALDRLLPLLLSHPAVNVGWLRGALASATRRPGGPSTKRWPAVCWTPPAIGLAIGSGWLRTCSRWWTASPPWPDAGTRPGEVSVTVAPPAGFEPALPPPEGGALSPELWGPISSAVGPSTDSTTSSGGWERAGRRPDLRQNDRP